MMPSQTSAILVVGGGPVGLATALGLAEAGLQTTLITAPGPPAGRGSEARSAALFAPSLRLLRSLAAWEGCASAVAPLKAIRLVDDTGHLLRAPELLFEAHETGVDAFGYNVPNAALAASLRAQLRTPRENLTWIADRSVVAVSCGIDGLGVTLDDGTMVEGHVLVAADGRGSIARQAAGIAVRDVAYDQVAVTATFDHTRPHNGVSTEFHRQAGPCTTVPLPGNRSALVWVERPAIAARLLAMDDLAFGVALEAQLKGLLGAVTAIAGRGRFPLTWMQAATTAARRVMLVGEAAHVMPPIGAQGLNLGFRDVGCLIDCLVDAVQAGRDPGGLETMAAYSKSRAADIGMRMTAVDALNRSLLSDLVPVHLARGAGLHLLAAFGPLRRRVMAEGMQPSGPLPRLMRAG
jgi:2-octaprenyl-6-methoxyphenol hydroxylase